MITSTKPDELLFLIRLFPEISIKSTPVRKRWTKMLADNIRLQVRKVHPKAGVIRDWDRIDVRIPTNGAALRNRVIETLACVSGIAHYAEVTTHNYVDMHDIYEAAYAVWKESLVGKSFCVRVKRVGKHDFSSTDVERYVGGGLNQNTGATGVDLKNPDVTVNIEIKDDVFFLVHNRYPGLGGFPIGTQDDVLSLVSGGFDSTVASYLMIKRGMRTHFCFFNLGGKAHEVAVKEVAFYLWNKFGSTHRVRFITVPFEDVVAEILEKVGPSNMGVVLKRLMLKAANRVAERGGIQALVTGEAISQVSSQTIHNLSIIDKVSDRLVFRPLITSDKTDIIALARKIGAEDFSASIPEYCGVISVKPSASVKESSLIEEEVLMRESVLDEALAKTRVQAIDEVMQDANLPAAPQANTVIGEGDCVIDIRHPDEVALNALHIETEALTIPFYRLYTEFEQLDKGKNYLLYCDKGVLSQLHAAHLLDEGYENVGVYRPKIGDE